MFTGHAQRQRRAALPPRQGRAGPVGLDSHIGNHNIGCLERALRTPIRHDAQSFTAGGVRQTHSALILRTRHQKATGNQTTSELDEDLFELLARVVAIQVIGLHIRDDFDRRRVIQERPIGLVGLGNEHVAGTQVSTRSQLRQHAAHGDGRIQAARRQRDRQHAGRRRLSVRASNAHKAHARRRQRERLRTVDHQLAALARNRQLRVVFADRG